MLKFSRKSHVARIKSVGIFSNRLALKYASEVIKQMSYDELTGSAIVEVVDAVKSLYNHRGWYAKSVSTGLSNGFLGNPNIDRFLGEGAYSCVYSLTSGRVLKINTADKSQDSWLVWGLKCMESNDNPMLPKIYSLHWYRDTYVAVMEQLEQVQCHGFSDKYRDNRMIDDPIEYHTSLKYNVENNPGFKLPDVKHVQSTSELARTVLSTTEGSGYDLHEDNVMFRDGYPVITDPIAGGSLKLNRSGYVMGVAA